LVGYLEKALVNALRLFFVSAIDRNTTKKMKCFFGCVFVERWYYVQYFGI